MFIQVITIWTTATRKRDRYRHYLFLDSGLYKGTPPHYPDIIPKRHLAQTNITILPQKTERKVQKELSKMDDYMSAKVHSF